MTIQSQFTLNELEAKDLLECVKCEIEKHKNEPYHTAYLDRLACLELSLTAFIEGFS